MYICTYKCWTFIIRQQFLIYGDIQKDIIALKIFDFNMNLKKNVKHWIKRLKISRSSFENEGFYHIFREKVCICVFKDPAS